MPHFLLEIGTEELPSGAIAPAVAQLKDALLARLREERLGVAPEDVRTWATPRRLALLVQGLPERQADAPVEARGPAVKVAFGPDGTPTKAAEGFARRQNVDVKGLVVEGDYVVARRTEPGRPTGEVLAAAVPDLLRALSFPKFMRWGAGNYRFGRPLRRFVALLDDEILRFEIEGVPGGDTTVGHRDLSRGPVAIPAPEAYPEALRAAFVEPDPVVRQEAIVAQARALAESIDGTAVLDPDLVEENVYLTEWVTAVLGAFDPAYLTLPRPVLVTAMKKHQRFFPVEDARVGDAQGNLLPHFIAVRNGGGDHLDTVRAGYEKVLASRFNDARFFFEHDRGSRLSDKVFKTERIVFQEKLGTLADKTKRLRRILEQTGLAEWTGDAEAALRAAFLAKADLASEIVMELPALQGVMGREFALLEGEPPAVAEALLEQYLPRFAGDDLPASPVGTALALADRADTLIGYMRFVGAEPRGSSDPFGLKRAAGAVVDLLARDAALPGVAALIAAAGDAYAAQGREPAPRSGDLSALLETRLRGLLEERDARHDLVDALLVTNWDNIAGLVNRAQVLMARMPTDALAATAQVATRVRNILRPAAIPEGDPDRALLAEPEELALLAALDAVLPQVADRLDAGDYGEAFDDLAALNGPINRFFDAILVNAEDAALRGARLALLARADRLYLRLADFSKLILE